MKIETSWISSKTGQPVHAYYEEVDDFSHLPQDKIKSVCAFCYMDNKFLIVKNEGRWEPIAGHVEPREKANEALVREVKEESNMRILKFFPVGFQYHHEEGFYQTRYFCLVEPYGPFISDPDGDVTEIKLIESEEFLTYINWKGTSTLIKEKCLKIIKSLKA